MAEQTPACRHFGTCGGCAAQDKDEATYRAWKYQMVAAPLRRAGFADVAIAEPIVVPPGSRRRVALKLSRAGGHLTLGFAERRSHAIVDVLECPVTRPSLVALFPKLREAFAPILSDGETVELRLTETATGIDAAMAGRQTRALDIQRRTALARVAERLDLARLICDGEPVALRRAPVVHFDGIAVELPEDGFLQAVEEGEQALRGLVTAAMGKAKIVVDLFAGCGTFALPLARVAKVRAYEGEQGAVDALTRAARATAKLKPVQAEMRDLFRRPLVASELRGVNAVVIDPPFAGAKAQMEELARSTVPVIASVSCNPATFARDARILADGGYRLESVTPVDQFLWSSHVECVGVFRKS